MTDHFCPIDHIAIDVVDFDTALAFFKDVFGMTVTRFQGPDIFKLRTGTGNIVIKEKRFCSHGIHIIDTDSCTIITYRVKSRHFRSQQQFSTYRISS